MDRIVIIGSSGAGKTTLAKELGNILKIRVYHLDRIFWGRGWKRIAREDRIDILEDMVQRKQWIIEGTYLKSSEPRLKAADTIIFLDIPPLACLQRIAKRHHEESGHFRRDLPMECKDRLTLIRRLKILVFPLTERRIIKQKLATYKDKKIIILCSSKEVEDFVAQQHEPSYELEASRSKLAPVTRLIFSQIQVQQ